MDLLIVNARALTQDPAAPRAEAVGVAGGQIAFVGSSAEALALRTSQTRLIDAGGATLLPGFIDSHYHLELGSLRLDGAQLGPAHDTAELIELLAAHAASQPDDPWVKGFGLRYDTLGARPLTRHDLDAVVPDRPALLMAFDGHTAWANTRALELCGILGGAACAPGNEIVMSSDGTASGELREIDAFARVSRRIPPLSDARRRELTRRGLAQAARCGITSIHNMDGDRHQLARYLALDSAGELTLRVQVPFSFRPEMDIGALDEAIAMRDAAGAGEMVRAGTVKLFMDGVIESGTGLLLAPYAGGDSCGEANFEAEQFDAVASAVDALKLQIIVHAIGDAAVRRTLDGYERALLANGRRDSRHRIEHIELVDAADLPRFAALGALAAMQPLHAATFDVGQVWLDRVGRARWPWSFSWRRLREAGARLAFGSDWPVVSQDVLAGIRAAVGRQPLCDDEPQQAQTLDEALRSYTADGAYFEHMETRKGMLRKGMLADLVLLDRDIEHDLAGAEVAMTVCGGRAVFGDGIMQHNDLATGARP